MSVEQAHQMAVMQLWGGDAAAALRTVLAADVLTADFVNMTIAAGTAHLDCSSQTYEAAYDCKHASAVFILYFRCRASRALLNPDDRVDCVQARKLGRWRWRCMLPSWSSGASRRWQHRSLWRQVILLLTCCSYLREVLLISQRGFDRISERRCSYLREVMRMSSDR